MADVLALTACSLKTRHRVVLIGILVGVLAACTSTPPPLPPLPETPAQLQQVVVKIQQQLLENPEGIRLHQRVAQAHLMLGEFEHADRQAREALRLAPLDPDLIELQGTIAMALRKNSRALKFFQSALRIKPDRPSLHRKTGQVHERLNELPQAVSALEEALQHDRNDRVALHLLAQIQLRQRLFEDALETVQLLLIQEPGAAAARQLRIRIYLEQGNLYYAKTLIEQGLQDTPESIDLQLNLLRVHYLQEEWDTVLSLASTLEASQPLPSEAQVIRALTYVQRREYETARQQLEPLVQKTPLDAELLLAMGFLELGEGNLREATVWLERAVQVNPKSALAHYLRASVHLRQGDILQGNLALQRALELDPHNPKYRQLHLQALLLDGQLLQVERTLKSWRKSEPLNPDLMFLECQYLLLKRQYSEAEILVRQALAIQGSEPLNLLLVQALYLQGKYASALEGSEALFLRQPWHWEIVHLHARILARMGRMESAKKLGERFIFRQDSQGQAHLLLGDLHREQNDPARAIKYYQTGLERYPEHTALLDALSSAHAEAGQWTELRDLLEIRVRRDAVQDSALVLRLLERLILAYRNLGENERARETWVRYQELNTGRNGQQPLLLPDPFILPSRIRSRLGAELSG